jgi:hypothetical protein
MEATHFLNYSKGRTVDCEDLLQSSNCILGYCTTQLIGMWQNSLPLPIWKWKYRNKLGKHGIEKKFDRINYAIQNTVKYIY